jgi:hypothetical protein
MSDEDLKAELERLRSENALLKKGASDGIRMKVSEKGAVSVYGMGRFPVTLYKEQWLKLLNMSDEIRSFIAENEARLKAKDWRSDRVESETILLNRDWAFCAVAWEHGSFALSAQDFRPVKVLVLLGKMPSPERLQRLERRPP